MDPISYGVAAKQKQRIEKVIAEPDSTSGVITVPQVIATGETITVPAGRTAVLPNVQVDGELVVDGEVFIPSGTGLSTVVQKSGDTMTGNLNFASGTKITGDFSNATFNFRTKFTTSTPNSNSYIYVTPSGTGTVGGYYCSGDEDISNTSIISMFLAKNMEARIASNKNGTGTYLPMTFYNSGAERMRIDTSGNVLVTGSGGLGYGTGSGGTVTQLTSKSTAVTLNKPSGIITMNNAALTAGATTSFVVNNNTVVAAEGTVDNIVVSIFGGISGYSNYRVQSTTINGGFVITLTNQTGISLSEAVMLKFDVIKGVIV